MKSISLVIVASLLSIAVAVPAYFTNFGPAAGDQTLYRNDDGYSGAINFSFNFLYFGTPRTVLYVDNNGLLSFDGPVSTYTPTGLAATGFSLIAPYWADVDTRSANGGEVYYRQTDDAADLGPISTFVQQSLHNPTFNAVKAFVVTYNNVGYYSEHEDKRCNFQVILAADANLYSAVIFNYGAMEWATGDASGGVGGFGGSPAVVGFSDGTGTNYVQLDGSATNDVIHINQGTNAFINGVPQTGRYVFYVSNTVSCINSDCCGDSTQSVFVGIPDTLTISASAAIPDAGFVFFVDSCSNRTCKAVEVTPVVVVSGTQCPYTITRTYSFRDACCRTQTKVQTINVVCDTTTPSTTGAAAVLTAPEFCANTDHSQWINGQGYYCSGTGFIQCWGTQGAFQNCAPGTTCRCAPGVECSAQGSPCA